MKKYITDTYYVIFQIPNLTIHQINEQATKDIKCWIWRSAYTIGSKRGKTFKGRLDSSQHFHLQWKSKLWEGKFAWGVNIAGHCQQTFENKKFVDITKQCFALLPQVNFPANNLNFHWRWWDWTQGIFLNLFNFTLNSEETGDWFMNNI